MNLINPCSAARFFMFPRILKMKNILGNSQIFRNLENMEKRDAEQGLSVL